MSKTIAQPSSIGRTGVYLHASGQYVSRIGFELNNAGRRVRGFQYLGRDPEKATLKHVELLAIWTWTKSEWACIQSVIRPGLPAAFRDTADLNLAVWIKDEWFAAAKAAGADEIANVRAGMRAHLEHAARFAVAHSFGGKEMAKYLAERPSDLAALPEPARNEIIRLSAPTPYEAVGFAADAQRVTIEHAKKMYLDDCRSRIGLPEDGIKPGTYQNTDRMLRLALGLKIDDKPAIDEKAMMESITRDDLVAFKRGWLAKVTAGTIAKRTAANYCKTVQFFLAWVYKRERIISRRVADLDDVFRFTDINPINIADYAVVKDDLKAIIGTASDRAKLYIYLAMNCGQYQVDIANIKLTEIQDLGAGKCIVRRRDKTTHQNDFASCHALWPETWALLEKHLAAADPATNPQGLALLNESGGPLYQSGADSARIDNVTSAYWRTMQTLNDARTLEGLPVVSLPFKQFRKLGATAINGIAGETAQRLYRTTAFEGADRFYVRGDFSTLTAALGKWREQLKADGVV